MTLPPSILVTVPTRREPSFVSTVSAESTALESAINMAAEADRRSLDKFMRVTEIDGS